jgi:predicted permease
MAGRAVTAALVRLGKMSLVLYPRPFRRAYGLDMVEVLADVCAAGDATRRPRWFAGLRALVLMARSGVRERLSPMGPTTFPNRPRVPRGKKGLPMSSLWQDASHAFRGMAARPAFTALTLGMLAFGIAANTTVFTLYNAVFLRPLPFPQPERLIDLDETAPDWGLEYVGISYPDFHAWRQNNSTFEAMAAFTTESFNLATDDAADRVRVALVSEDMLAVLGIQPALGRALTADDHAEGADVAVLLTHTMWRDRFESSPDVLGTTLRIDGTEATVVGVLSADAVFPTGVGLWAPLSILPYCCAPTERAGSWWLEGVGRLKPGVTVAQAAADLDAAHAPLVEEFGGSREIATPRIQPLVERYMGDVRPMMMVMLIAVGLLLVITCANVGGLMLAQGTARNREVSIRLALGAGRVRILRQLLTESLVLALVGGALGLLVSRLAIVQVVGLIPQQNIGWLDFSFDYRVFLFAAIASGAAAVLFGMAPAIAASSRSPHTALQQAGLRTAGGPGARRALSSLVVVEVALAVVLLVGSVLLVQVTGALNSIEPGFRDDVLVFAASLPNLGYPDHESQFAFYDEVERRLATAPGVTSVGLTTHAPLGGHTGNFFAAEDTILAEDDSPVVLTRNVSPGYFETVGIELLHGRPFDDQDGAAARRVLASNNADEDEENDEPLRTVIVVNETFAQTFWGRTDVVGRIAHNGRTDYEVIGVTRDTKHYGLDEEMRPGVFIPHRYAIDGTMTIAVRGGSDPTSLTGLARDAVRQIDAEVPIFGDTTLADSVYASMWQRRLAATMIGIFAAAALLLSLAGIHGTVSFTVGQRTREIGIRLALGAQQSQVVRRVLRQGIGLAVIGLVGGIALAFAGAGLLSSVLFGVSAQDPTPYVLVGTILALATAAATFLPARRAARTDLVDALRKD